MEAEEERRRSPRAAQQREQHEKCWKNGLVRNLHSLLTRSRPSAGSCPNLLMSSPAPPPARRPLCTSASSDSGGRFRALQTAEWKNNLRAQMQQAHSGGAGSSTGSLERSSLFCPPPEVVGRAGGRLSVLWASWSGGGEPAAPPAAAEPPPPASAEPVISMVTDFIFVGNANAAYSGRTLCRNNIASIIDTSGEARRCLIPCTCPRGGRHSWPRLRVDLGDAPRRRCFDDINRSIDAAAGRGRRVLVHCGDGASLGPACVIQYLMLRRDMRLQDAYELLRAKHPLNISDRHQDVLVSLETSLRPGADPQHAKHAISRRTAWT